MAISEWLMSGFLLISPHWRIFLEYLNNKLIFSSRVSIWIDFTIYLWPQMYLGVLMWYWICLFIILFYLCSIFPIHKKYSYYISSSTLSNTRLYLKPQEDNVGSFLFSILNKIKTFWDDDRSIKKGQLSL